MAASSSDSPVHQLWPPSGGKQSTELDVVLFHGLQLTANDTIDAWSSTWTQRGHDDVCWAQEWLPFDLGEAVRIFSVSYNAHVVTSPHDHVSEISHNLFQNLMNHGYEWHHPIVLIGHSFGGLVLKSLVVKLNRESTIRNPINPWSRATVQCAKVFLGNVRGVAFYAVPHAGSSNIGQYVNKLLRCNNRHHPGIMDNIQPRQRDMEQLSVDFDRIVAENEINIYAFCEGRPMEQVGILVDVCSAQRSAGDNFYKVEDADHMEVCKPPRKEHPSYGLLLQFIITCGKEARECDQALQEVHDLPESTFGLESYVERVIGGAMFRKASCEWEPLLKKLRESRMYERPVEEELFERLKLGYDLLSEDDWRLKQCFHYFAGFPEDDVINFNRVLYHWIGEGLVPAHDGDDPRADAFSLLNKLWERSFIESRGEIHHSLIDMEYNPLRFKVHDVMRDLAFYIQEKDCGTPPGKQLYFYRAGQNLEEVPKECTAIPEALRLSLDTNKLEKLPESFYAPKLVSLLLGDNRIVSLSASFFRNFPKLRVLDLSYGEFYSLPEELGDLKDLVGYPIWILTKLFSTWIYN
ncbi:unnamed protein product [Sphagnum troendelagicum]|uniref:Disease resistance protein winged helix domain-containing protein n=1 Tax=Sphagnum troendelagicum TaxID=128251 RepID=A0ABP0UUW8_9BRYO